MSFIAADNILLPELIIYIISVAELPSDRGKKLILKAKICLTFIILAFLSEALYSQDKIPVYKNFGEYFREWVLIGSFSPDSLDHDFLTGFGGEKKFYSFTGTEISDLQLPDTSHIYYKSGDTPVNLIKAFGSKENATAYAFCYIYSDSVSRKHFYIGSDDRAKVWINGSEVFENREYRSLFLDENHFEINLNKGLNTCLIKITQGTGDWAFSLRTGVPNEKPEIPDFYIFTDKLEQGTGFPDQSWKFRNGDNREWADPGFDDYSWAAINSILPETDWRMEKVADTCWFRVHFAVEDAILNKPLAISLFYAGKGEVFLNGEKILRFGFDEDYDYTKFKTINLSKKRGNVLSVRYFPLNTSKYFDAGFGAGFYLDLKKGDHLAHDLLDKERSLTGYQMFFTSLTIAIGVLHLIIFFFFPGLRQNLYFSLFLFSYAATIYFDYSAELVSFMGDYLTYLRLHRLSNILFFVLLLRFAYALFYDRLLYIFWVLLSLILLLGLPVVLKPLEYWDIFGIANLAIQIEIIRIVILAIYRKKEGAKLIGLAFFIFYFFGSFDAMMDMGIIAPFREMQNPYAFGSIGFFLAMSVYLSRNFARTSKRLADEQLKKELLEAENRRQSKELEEARRLQLSMIPENPPEIPGLEIAAYINTATEVGGDYYDFHLDEDGSLTIAIGDATGHGMHAGIMVSAAKSMFRTLAGINSPREFLLKGTKAIKAMNLKQMYMAMTIARIENNVVKISSAGMPFPLIYRKSSGILEEFILKGMPLGAFDKFPYEEKESELLPGDILLLMSDGLPELFNKKKEMFGAEKIKRFVAESSAENPESIINILMDEAKNWLNEKAQDDDITLLVIKFMKDL